MKLWIDVRYEASVEGEETAADHAKMDDVISECLKALDAQIIAAAKREGLEVRFTYD